MREELAPQAGNEREATPRPEQERVRERECELERKRELKDDLRRLEALRPIDDEFMRAMYQDQLELAQDTLRTMTGIEDLVLTREEVQRDVKRLAGSRSIVLDVYGEDSRGARYDLEVQRADKGAEPRRARYYGSAMDVEALGRGRDFSELPERYVVFVTEDDFFGLGAGAYRFEARDPELGLSLGDGAHVVYVNGRYRGDDALGRLMHDFSCSDPDDMHAGPLAERARYLKRNPKGVSTMSQILDEMRAEAMERGMARGMAGLAEKLRERGVDEALLAAAADAVRAEGGQGHRQSVKKKSS